MALGSLILALLSFLFGGGALGYVLVIERRLTRLEVLAEGTAAKQAQIEVDVRLALGWDRRRTDRSQPVPTMAPERPESGPLDPTMRRP